MTATHVNNGIARQSRRNDVVKNSIHTARFAVAWMQDICPLRTSAPELDPNPNLTVIITCVPQTGAWLSSRIASTYSGLGLVGRQ